MERFLNIAYDNSEKDLSVLMVMENNGEKMKIVNAIIGNKADEIYNGLVGSEEE